jgi:hypothetical protein
MLTLNQVFRGNRWLCLTIVVVVFLTDTALADSSGRVQPSGDRYARPPFFVFGYANGGSNYPFELVLSAVADVPANGTVYILGGGGRLTTYHEALILRKPMVLKSIGGPATIGAGVAWSLIDFPTPGGHEVADDDGDGIVDACEQYLAEKYAPIIYHSSDESNLPANVDWFLARTRLRFYDDACDFPSSDLYVTFKNPPLTQQDLLGWWYANGCGDTYTDHADGTRSTGKHRTFFLEDINDHIGCTDSRDWTTYYHAYPNTGGGITIQYWRCYAFNDAANNHGGDWEGIHVVLDYDTASTNYRPTQVCFLGHTSIEYYTSNHVKWSGTHPIIFSEGGGHASHPNVRFINSLGLPDSIRALDCNGNAVVLNPSNPCTYVRQETWTGGHVQWPNNPHVAWGTVNSGLTTPGGALLNVGAKVAPMNGQVFIRYSGIWGSPGHWPTQFDTSGYWGPAFNETGMGSDGFLTAWGAGITNVLRRECYPAATSP